MNKGKYHNYLQARHTSESIWRFPKALYIYKPHLKTHFLFSRSEILSEDSKNVVCTGCESVTVTPGLH